MSSSEIGAHSETASRPSKAYTRYVLFMIFMVAVFNTCDRTIMSVMVDDIKDDLLLSDRQMGFIMGLAFAIVHFLAGIPLARLADRWSRPRIISAALLTWSAMTALGGMAQNFMQLAITRMGVGIGEAGGSPPSHALIAEYVSEDKRARAMSALTIGAIVGLGIGVIYGGWASQHHGWRFALISVGLPGSLLAILFWFTVKDRRAQTIDIQNQPSLKQSLLKLFSNRAFLLMTLAACMVNITSMGRGLWEPTFLRRVYEMSAAEAGAWYFFISSIPTVIGAFTGGYLIDYLSRRDYRWYGWLPALASLILVPLSVTFYLYPTKNMLFGLMPTAFIFSILISFFASFWAPATMSLAQQLSPANSRALAAAAWSMTANFIGLGLGPLIVGDLNSRLEPVYGEQAVKYSLLIMSLTPIFAAWFYYKTAGHLSKKQIVPIS
jgi:MFS family permease